MTVMVMMVVVVVTGNFAFLGKHQPVQKIGLIVRSDTGKNKTWILILYYGVDFYLLKCDSEIPAGVFHFPAAIYSFRC